MRVKLGIIHNNHIIIDKKDSITCLPVVNFTVTLFEKGDKEFVGDLQAWIEEEAAALREIIIWEPAVLIVHSGWADHGVSDRVQDFHNMCDDKEKYIFAAVRGAHIEVQSVSLSLCTQEVAALFAMALEEGYTPEECINNIGMVLVLQQMKNLTKIESVPHFGT